MAALIKKNLDYLSLCGAANEFMSLSAVKRFIDVDVLKYFADLF
jgi:hypothetical protein